MSIDDLGLLKWYMDGLHNIHWDCKGREGVIFRLGKGEKNGYLQKVKLNTQSSTETELVTADMSMPTMLWLLYFIESQGYGAECVGLYQDSISTQLLIKNGKFPSKKKTKHVKAKFFFIKDRVDDSEIKVIGCSAEDMWADILTKSLQGMVFRTMRAVLINCPVNYKDKEEVTKTKLTKGVAITPVPGRKMVSWKKDICTFYQAHQECVGQNRSNQLRLATYRWLGIGRFFRQQIDGSVLGEFCWKQTDGLVLGEFQR